MAAGPDAPREVVRAAMLRLANGFAKGTSGVRTELLARRRRCAQRRRDAARAHARLGRPERSRAARRPRARHLRRHAPGRQGGHLADQQQLLRHGPGGARAGRRRCGCWRRSRSPPRSTGRPSRPTPPPSTRPSPSPGPIRASRARSARMRELLAGSYLWERGRGAQPAGSAHVPQRRGHPRAPPTTVSASPAPSSRSSSTRRTRTRSSSSPTSSSSRSPNYEVLPLAAALDFARIALVPAISSAQERSVKLLQAPLTGLGTGLQEAEAESNECALSELAWASQALMVEARSLAHPVSTETRLDDARRGHRGPHHDGAAGRAPAERAGRGGRGAARARARQSRRRPSTCAAARRSAPAPPRAPRRCASATRSSPRASRSGPIAATSSSSCARARSVPATDAQSLRPWLAPAGGQRAAGRDRGRARPGRPASPRVLVAHDREPVRVAHVRGSDLPLVANLLAEPRADRRGARRRPRRGSAPRSPRALEAPLEPVVGRAAACQEVVERDPDLAQLPIPRFFEHEGGPYITAGCIVARDPETGERNWSIARVRPLGGSRALVGIAPNHHLAVAARAARERGSAAADRRHGRQPPGADDRGLPLPGARRGRAARRRRAARRARRARRLHARPARGAGRLRARARGRARPRRDGRRGPGLGVPRRLRALRQRRHGDVPAASRAGATRSTRRSCPASTPSTRCSAASRSRPGSSARCARLVPSVRGRRRARERRGPARGRRRARPARAPTTRARAALAALEAVNLVKLVTVVDDDVDPWDDAAVAHAVATRVHFDRDLHVLPGDARRPRRAARARRRRSRSSRSTPRARPATAPTGRSRSRRA